MCFIKEKEGFQMKSMRYEKKRTKKLIVMRVDRNRYSLKATLMPIYRLVIMSLSELGWDRSASAEFLPRGKLG